MSVLNIETPQGRTDFEPGETIELFAEWQLDARPECVEVRVVWHTRGKGDADWEQVLTERFEGAQAYASRHCRLTLPESPYSFSGKLVSLLWSIELVAEPSGESTRVDITIGPGGKEVHLASDVNDQPAM